MFDVTKVIMKNVDVLVGMMWAIGARADTMITDTNLLVSVSVESYSAPKQKVVFSTPLPSRSQIVRRSLSGGREIRPIKFSTRSMHLKAAIGSYVRYNGASGRAAADWS